MSTESADKTEPSDLDMFCYGLYLRAVSGDQCLTEMIPRERTSAERVRAQYAIAQGTMMNRRVPPAGAYAATEPAIAPMSCRQLSEETTRALQWIA